MKIYADNAATTKMSRAAIEAMLPYMSEIYGNPSSLHQKGREAKAAITAAREKIAAILGVKPGYNGLEVNPSIPHEWDGFSISRLYRGATYNIKVSNPDHVCSGVKSMVVDGKEVSRNVIPVFADGEHTVEVILG